MKNGIIISFIMLISLLIISCSSKKSEIFILTVDKSVAHPKESESKTPIALEEFKIDDNKISYEIEFSNDKTKITIKGKEIFKGAIVQNKDNQLVYDLIEGTFAGGRFIFFDKESKEGELTIYGSGVPIIKSERGKMILK